MLNRIVAAGFQDVVEADQVAFDIDIRMVDGVADTGLGGKVDDHGGLVFGKDLVNETFVRDGAFDEDMLDRARFCSFLDQT